MLTLSFYGIKSHLRWFGIYTEQPVHLSRYVEDVAQLCFDSRRQIA
jgi:hypothetical protein